MTASQQAKKEGLKSLSQVSTLTGQSLQTLGNWAKNKPELFEIVLRGCKAVLPATGSGVCNNPIKTGKHAIGLLFNDVDGGAIIVGFDDNFRWHGSDRFIGFNFCPYCGREISTL